MELTRRAILVYATPRSGESAIERRGEAPARTRERGGVNVSAEVRRAVLEHAARGWVTGTLLVCTRRRRHMKCEGRTSAARRVRGSQASAREESAPQGNKTPLQRGSKIQDIYSKQARRAEHRRKNTRRLEAPCASLCGGALRNDIGTYTTSSTARSAVAEKCHVQKSVRDTTARSAYLLRIPEGASSVVLHPMRRQ